MAKETGTNGRSRDQGTGDRTSRRRGRSHLGGRFALYGEAGGRGIGRPAQCHAGGQSAWRRDAAASAPRGSGSLLPSRGRNDLPGRGGRLRATNRELRLSAKGRSASVPDPGDDASEIPRVG